MGVGGVGGCRCGCGLVGQSPETYNLQTELLYLDSLNF